MADEARVFPPPTDRPLPDFSDPPVAEVVLSVSFEPVAGLRVVQLGDLWKTRFADRFPRVEEQPPWEAPIERFGQFAGGPTISFQALQVPPLPRLWFVDERGTELVQAQSNWFARNWRKTDEDPDYPRYPKLRAPFRKDLKSFVDFVSQNKLGEWVPNQCEVTYVNHVDVGEVRGNHGELYGVLALAAKPKDPFLPTPEAMTVSSQYVLTDTSGGPVGRLYVHAQPGFRRGDGAPLVILTITARGRPSGPSINDVTKFLDRARESVVRGFAAVTTKAMHKVWGRTDAAS